MFIRKLFSAYLYVKRSFFSFVRKKLILLKNSKIQISGTPSIEDSVKISCTDGGQLIVGIGVVFREGAEVVTRGGRISIGDNVHIGKGVVIVSHESVQIGDGTQIAEYVVIRDQDHDIDLRPIHLGGFKTSSIKIGKDCWLGAKVTVLRGSKIGDGSVIGAHSLVRGVIQPYTLAVGCPARFVRELQ